MLKCQTPLHAGSGSDLNFVDLPIQRERHTSFPKIEASSLKGSLREHFRKDIDDKIINALFGSGSTPGEVRQAGALGVSDARLLFFPVRSVKGLFAWITCPEVLQRLKTDLELCGMNNMAEDLILPEDIRSKVLVSTNSDIVNLNSAVILEEYAFPVKEHEFVNKLGQLIADHLFGDGDLYWKNKMKNSIVILNDDDFRDFVNLATEVITRTKISPETGTVEQGALFTEEYLPVESVLYALIFAGNEYVTENASNKNEKLDAAQVLKHFSDKLNQQSVFQLGGSATIGKGILSSKLISH